MALNSNWLKPLDRMLLQHCEADFVVLQPLLLHVPRGTLYRHVTHLVGAGRLAEMTANFDWNIWNSIYPPLKHVPSAAHRALTELIAAAVVARRAATHDDHHPGFLAMGPTLAWKTTLAKFQCAMLGVPSSEVIIDLTTETTRSLWIRRDGTGTIAFKRQILERAFIVFDDYLEADSRLRATIHHFLNGRKVVPVENSMLTIEPVSLLTLNPRTKATLEEQTTLSPAQLRRLVVVDFSTVTLPDLALIGHNALTAAVEHGPLTLNSPASDAAAWRPQIVTLMRSIIAPHVFDRVDTEMLVVMATGMTGFIPDTERAIQQTLYDFAVTAETLGWTRPGWVEAVSRFSLQCDHHRGSYSRVQAKDASAEEDIILLRRNAMDGYKESAMPQFAISDEDKARMIAIAIDENIPFNRALEIVLNYYIGLNRIGLNLHDLHSILELSKDLQERSIPAKDVRVAMRLRQALRANTLSIEDVDAALMLVPMLAEQGLNAQDDHVETVIRLAARLLSSNRSLTDIEKWLKE